MSVAPTQVRLMQELQTRFAYVRPSLAAVVPLENADREALAMVREHKEQTRRLAEALLERETLTREEVVALLKIRSTKSGKIDYALN